MKATTFSKIKRGESFRFPNKAKVYIYEGKPVRGHFCFTPFDDINGFQSTKTDRAIEIGFEF